MNIINTNVYEHVEYWFQICMYACVASLNQSNHSPARIMFLGYLLSQNNVQPHNSKKNEQELGEEAKRLSLDGALRIYTQVDRTSLVI